MKLIRSLDRFSKSFADLIPEIALNITARVAVFMIFWPSAQTKLGGSTVLGQKWQFWELSPSTFMLFEYDYNLPIIPANIAAYAATWGEFFLSIFVLLGLLTRISALALLVMVLVIQVFVYPHLWASHLLWASALLYLLKYGSGQFSADALTGRHS